MPENFMDSRKRKNNRTFLRSSSRSKIKEKSKRVPGNNLMDTDYTASTKTIRKVM